jgi:VanZ family protein
MGVIYLVSSSSDPFAVIPDNASASDENIGRVAHILEYAILAVLTANAILKGRQLSRKDVINIFIFSISYALFDELHQNSIPDRSFQLLDLGLDAIGTLVGMGTFHVFSCFFDKNVIDLL